MGIFPLEYAVDFTGEFIQYWSESWNKLNIPLRDWVDSDIPMLDVFYDLVLNKLGIGHFTLLQFVLLSGVTYLLFFTVVKWLRLVFFSHNRPQIIWQRSAKCFVAFI